LMSKTSKARMGVAGFVAIAERALLVNVREGLPYVVQ
jgi:hypothetical protein